MPTARNSKAMSPTLAYSHTQGVTNCSRTFPPSPVQPCMCQAPSGFPHPPTRYLHRAAPTSLGRPAFCKAGLSIQAGEAPVKATSLLLQNPREWHRARTRPGQGRTGRRLGEDLVSASGGRGEGAGGGGGFSQLFPTPRPSPPSWPPFHPLLPHTSVCPLSWHGLWLGGTGAPGRVRVEGRR